MKKKKWSQKEQGTFLQRLGRLIQKGYPLLGALEFLQLQAASLTQEDIGTAIDLLKQGNSAYKVFVHLSFHPDVLGYLFYAEKYGNLGETLEKAGQLLLNREKQQKQFFKIIQYPLFLTVFLSILLLLFNWILLPQFRSIFRTLGNTSISMNFIFGILSLFPLGIYFLLFCFFSMILFYFTYFRKQSPLEQMKIKLKIPYMKTVFRLLNTHYLSYQLGTLLLGGLSISDGCTLMAKQKHHPFFGQEAAYIHEALKEGEELAEVIEQRGFYDVHFPFVIRHGLRCGTLDKELYDYSDYVLERLEELVNKGINFIQPIVYGVIAVVIVLIYVAMLLPMLEMIHHI